MIKIPLNYDLNIAFSDSMFFGEAIFGERLLNIGDLHLLKDNYANLWVNIEQHTTNKGHRLVVELDNPPSSLSRINNLIEKPIGNVKHERFFCIISYDEDFATCKLLNVHTMVPKNELNTILKGMSIKHFAESVLTIFLNKRLVS